MRMITREWKHKGCAMTFGTREAMRIHWRKYHADKKDVGGNDGDN